MSENELIVAIVTTAAQQRRNPRMKLRICFLVGLLLATGCQTVVHDAYLDNGKRPLMSLPEARRSVSDALQQAKHGYYTAAFQARQYEPLAEILVTHEGFSFTGLHGLPSGKYSYQFKEIHHLTVLQDGSWFEIDMEPEGRYRPISFWQSKEDARRFVDAVQAIKYYSSIQPLADDAAAFTEFQEKARAWRALPQKPPLSEDVQRFRVVAEDAFQKKEFEKAADYYEQGLAVEPLWPQGQFNAALLYGELQMYAQAVIHMKRYLELEPDAANAKAARGKMYLWEVKAKEQKLTGTGE
jgi:tetratricopeptide (TPR) repeat protein